jgi:hypothetical protein
MYDPANVVITWGNNLIQGYAKNTFIKASRSEDAFSMDVGADGEVSRARNRNRTGTVEVTLGQWSQSNDVFSAGALADELTGTGVQPLLIKDLFGTTLLEAPHAWVKKRADIEFGREQGDRVWVLDCDLLLGNIGGQASLP